MRVPFVSVTRLHLARIWSMPPFLYYSLASARQARASAGFVAGWLSNDAEWGFWTSTVWDSPQSMRAFRNSGVHLKAMPKLLRWCDEASFVHWEQPEAAAPGMDTAFERLSHGGQLSKLYAPSPRHAAGGTVGRTPPRRAQILAPRA